MKTMKKFSCNIALHETKDGQWMPKVRAIKSGMTLTGRKKMIETAPLYTRVLKNNPDDPTDTWWWNF